MRFIISPFAMLIQTVTTQRVLIFVLARKDTLEMDSHVKVNKSSPHYLKQAALHRNNCPWKLALILETCCHAPLSYFYYHTFCISLMLLDIDECNNGSHDCDVNANCTNTVPVMAPVRKDTLEKESHVKVRLG